MFNCYESLMDEISYIDPKFFTIFAIPLLQNTKTCDKNTLTNSHTNTYKKENKNSQKKQKK